MKILITGGSGFLGTAVCKRLAYDHEIYVLTRNKRRASSKLNTEVTLITSQDPFPKVDAILNFAGAAISARILTQKRMNVLLNSRIRIMDLLQEKYRGTVFPPLFIQASATGIYSNDQTCDESGACNGAFASLIKALEDAAKKRFEGITCLALIRFGVIMGEGGGLNRILKRLPKLQIIPDQGNFVPWIALEDAAAIITFLLEHPLRGVVNAVSPDLKTANTLLAAGKGSGPFLPSPRFLLNIPFDRRGKLLTASHIILSSRLINAGFKFKK